jgi:hypothetical protein
MVATVFSFFVVYPSHLVSSKISSAFAKDKKTEVAIVQPQNLFFPPEEPRIIKIEIIDSEYMRQERAKAEEQAKIANEAKKREIEAVKAKPAPSPSIPSLLAKIRSCESGGNYQAQNHYSTASGAYQFLDSTWNSFGGYKKARHAPANLQDEKALATFQSSGTSPWLASRSCWSK